MLHQAFPRDKDPDWNGGYVTPDHEFSELRASIPRILFQRGSDEDRSALDELVHEQPYLQDWYDRVKAQEKARGELSRATLIGPDSPQGRPPSPQAVRKLLENGDYRIIRNNDDLLDVLVELLCRIGQEAGRHIEMLYVCDRKTGDRKRQHESALQSYLDCRLSDLLPGRILESGTEVQIHREPQGQFRQRMDIRVDAPLVNRGVGTVIIEVKWSDNRDPKHNASTALTTQLGERYLIGDGQTHGIYLVGWNGRLGTWKRSAGKPPAKPVTPQTLEEALKRQAQAFCASNKEVAIEAVVLDLAWPKSQSTRKLQPTPSERQSQG